MRCRGLVHLALYFYIILREMTPIVRAETPHGMKLKEYSDRIEEILQSYDVKLRPNFGEDPVTVGVTLWIDSIGPISEVNMDFKISYYFRQYWTDERLAFNGTRSISLGIETLERIWLPDTFFPHDKHSYIHDTTRRNSLLRIDSGGGVLYSSRVTAISTCPMDLNYFPMDVQNCTLHFESFGYQMDDIQYTWKEPGSLQLNDMMSRSLAQFELMDWAQGQENISLSTGKYSRLLATFTFNRMLGYFLIQTYFPAILIVIISWVSFWIHRNAIPARASLGITTVLTMITLISSTNSSLPKLSYIKAIDVYLIVCFLYVFAALLEFSIVCYYDKPRFLKKKTEKAEKNSPEFQRLIGGPDSPARTINANRGELDDERLTRNNGDTGGYDGLRNSTLNNSNIPVENREKRSFSRRRQERGRPSNIDIYSRIFFPVSFIILNIVYWVAYLRVTHRMPVVNWP